MKSSAKQKIAAATLFCLFGLPLSVANADADASAICLTTGNLQFANKSNPLLVTRTSDSLEIIKAIAQKSTVTINNKEVAVNCVLIPKNAGLTADLGLAQNSIGQTEELMQLAQHSSAEAAINGGYFQSYDTTKPMDPYGTLIKNGTLIHKGDSGSVLGFTTDGEVAMGTFNIAISGSTDKKTFKIDNINHTPNQDSNSVTLFNNQRGKNLGFNYGVNIIVQRGEVVKIVANSDAAIPPGGFVLNLQGTDQDLQKSLTKGTKVDYKVSYTDTSGCKINWAKMETAIGAGPMLLRNSENVLDPAKEGFTDEKSFTMTAARSAVGLNKDGNLLLVAGVNCTLSQLSGVMSQLGAVDAISMDGGASSGLYANGQYIVKPSRTISNALVFNKASN